MGISKRHARSVPLVLNFDTGNITAQWNVVFDNWFSTVATNVDDMPDFHAEEWANMFRTSIYDGDDDEELHEVVKQPAIRNDREIEDDGMEEEELLRQPMLQPNPLIQPNQKQLPIELTRKLQLRITALLIENQLDNYHLKNDRH